MLTITCSVVRIEFKPFMATTFIRRCPVENGTSAILCTIICHTILTYSGICMYMHVQGTMIMRPSDARLQLVHPT